MFAPSRSLSSGVFALSSTVSLIATAGAMISAAAMVVGSLAFQVKKRLLIEDRERAREKEKTGNRSFRLNLFQ